MLDNQQKNNVKTDNSFNRLFIEIPSNKSFFMVGFLSFWTFGWAAGEFFALREVFFSKTVITDNLFLVLWLSIWTYGGVAIAGILAWFLLGKEIIEVDSGLLKLRKNILIYEKKKVLEITKIKNIAFNKSYDRKKYSDKNFQNPFQFNVGFIMLDYDDKRFRFIMDASEENARMIYEAIKSNRNFSSYNFEQNN